MDEKKIFLNKLSKNKEKKLEWKYYFNQLFSPDIIFYNSKQISLSFFLLNIIKINFIFIKFNKRIINK